MTSIFEAQMCKQILQTDYEADLEVCSVSFYVFYFRKKIRQVFITIIILCWQTPNIANHF